jgi:hypothetical protein
MKIKVLTTFLDGSDRFEKDDVRTVNDADAERFIANGWASDGTADPVPQPGGPVNLDVQDSNVGQEASYG